MKHLRSLDDLGSGGVARMLELSDRMADIGRRAMPKVPALRGRTVAMCFFEDSTRTRLSFDTAAKRLSADTMTFSVSTSSVNKGESLRDTIETLEAMGVDAFVVRHRSSGVPWQISRWTSSAVVNAGDGWHQHPTQALLDAYTLWTSLGRASLQDGRPLAGVHVGIIGDIKHSRVARSDVQAFTQLGARVTLVAPPTLLPASLEAWPAEVTDRLDDVFDELDVVYLLRMQSERLRESLLPDLREYTTRFGLTSQRAARLRPEVRVMHPGPMNRGVEIGVDPASLAHSLILDQVTNGVAVRMAVLFDLLAGGADAPFTTDDIGDRNG
jgi:aspartate carbamoyltransferase catalytic subunit